MLSYIAESGMSKKVSEDVYERLRREVNLLSKLRHPSLMKIIEPLEESKSEISFVAEPIIGCLKGVLDVHSRSSFGGSTSGSGEGHSSDDDGDWNDLVIQRGLLQVTEGLMFLHNHAGYVHLDIQPTSIVIDSKGDWKLAGMGFATSYHDLKGDYFIDQYDPRLPQFVQINLDYSAPELVLDHKLDPTNDVFSLGCLMMTIYCSKPPLSTNNNPSSYKGEFQTISRQLRNPSIPSHLSSVIPRVLTRSPLERIDLSSLKQSEYFDNALVRTINFLDEFPGKLASEKKVFLQGIFTMLPQFPKSVRQRKILVCLLDELGKEEAIDYLILKNVLTIGKDMSQLGFTEKILPSMVAIKSEDGCQAAIIDFLDVLLSRTSTDDFKKHILPIWTEILLNSESDRQRDVLAKITPVVEKLDFIALKNEIFPPVGEVFGKTTSLGVKLECLKAFRVFIGHELDKYVISEKLIPLLGNMKTREPHIIMAALDVYSAFVDILDVETLAVSIIPHILALSMESTLTVDQYKLLMDRVRMVLEKVEKEKIKRLANNVPQQMTSRPSSTTQNHASQPQALDFNSLISGSSNTQSTVSTDSFGALKLESTNKTMSIMDLDSQPVSPPPPSSSSMFGTTSSVTDQSHLDSNSTFGNNNNNDLTNNNLAFGKVSHSGSLSMLQSQSRPLAFGSNQQQQRQQSSLNAFPALNPQGLQSHHSGPPHAINTTQSLSTISGNGSQAKSEYGNFQSTPVVPRLDGPKALQSSSFSAKSPSQSQIKSSQGLDQYQSLL